MLTNYFQTQNSTELIFWGFAVFGTVFFLLRVMMMVLGGFGAEGADGDLSNDVDVDLSDDIDGDAHPHDHNSTDHAFKLLSINSVTGFLMMFGWAGLASYKEFHTGNILAFAIAFLIGFLTMLISAYIFQQAMKLTSQGSQFKLEETLGKRANVYLEIPEKGRGKIQLSQNDLTHTIEAISEDGVKIPSFIDVEIIRKVDPHTVSVRAL